MTASAWACYDTFKEYMGDGTIDMDADEFFMVLALSTSNAATLSTDVYASLTNEVATNYGYTQGGQGCTVTISNANQWIRSTGTTKFDVDDIVWNASGGSIVARFAVIFDTTPTSPADPLVAYTLLDTTPADVTATSGNSLTITIAANGVFQLS